MDYVLFDKEQKVKKKRAAELKAEYPRYDCSGSISVAVEALALKNFRERDYFALGKGCEDGGVIIPFIPFAPSKSPDAPH